MPHISPVNSSAALILLQNKPTPTHRDKDTSSGDGFLATANGIDSREDAKDVKTADDYWGVFQVDPTQMKVKLFIKLGEAFGLDMKDFVSIRSFGEAIRAKVEKMKMSPEGRQHLAEIEEQLGLNELGISLDTLIEAAIDPNGAANDELEAAIENLLKEDEELAEAVEVLDAITVDGNGVYSL